MKKLLITLVLVCVLATLKAAQSTAPAPASGSESPQDIVLNGFDAMETRGYATALNIWVKNSYLGMEKSTIARLNKYYSTLLADGYVGDFTGGEIIQTVNLSASTEEIYAAAKYEHQEVFMSFTCFKPHPTDKWVISSINMNTDPTKILPTNILGGQMPFRT